MSCPNCKRTDDSCDCAWLCERLQAAADRDWWKQYHMINGMLKDAREEAK